MKPGKDGRLYAINPENGFFGVAPGTNEHSNPNALACTKSGTIFTNVALNNTDNTVWWEKLDKNPPVDATEWTGKKVNGPEFIAEGGKLAHRTQIYFSGKELPVPVSGIQQSGRCTDLRYHLRRSSCIHHSAGISVLRLDTRHLYGFCCFF